MSPRLLPLVLPLVACNPIDKSDSDDGSSGSTTTATSGGTGSGSGSPTEGSGSGSGSGGSTSSAATSTSASSGATSTTDSTGASGSSAGPDIDCSVKPQVFPEFDKSCRTVDDCIIVLHTDCCGPLALGLNQAEADAFAAAEAICGPQCPPLGCDHPTIAEDGDPAPQEADVQVECADGLCRTFVP